MTAIELINSLKEIDPQTIIVVDGYEGGYTSPKEVKKIKIIGPLAVDWYYGEYEKAESAASEFQFEAVYLSRR